MERPLIVVTGASGRVGQHVVVHLLQSSYPHVRAAFHHLTDAEALPPNVERAPIEYHDPQSVRAALEGAERMFLVTPGGVQQAEETRILVQAAVACGVKHIVKVGTLACDVPPILPTDAQCAEAERLVRFSGCDYTFLRCSFFNQIFISPEALDAAHAGHGFVALCEGHTGWVDCRDVGEAAANVLMNPKPHVGKQYNLTGPESLSFADIQEIMSQVAGHPIQFTMLTDELIAQMYARESNETIEARMGCLVKLREGYITDVSGDLRQLLDRAPRTFETFARDHAHLLFPDSEDLDRPLLFENEIRSDV